MSKIIDILIKTILHLRRSVYLSLGFVDQVLFGNKNKIFILAYHSIATDTWRFSVDYKEILKQIEYLRGLYDIIPLAEALAYINGKKLLRRPSVVLTFDDGYKDVLQLKSYFAKHNIKPTLFVLAEPKHTNYKELGTKRKFLNKKEIQSVIKANWEIGCHSGTHANLSELTKSEIVKEVITAKKSLEQTLGVSIPYFSYPRGKYTESVLQTVKKAKYLLAVTMDDGFITAKTNPLLIPRIGIDRTHTFEEFKTTFSPSVVRVRQLIKQSFVGAYL